MKSRVLPPNCCQSSASKYALLIAVRGSSSYRVVNSMVVLTSNFRRVIYVFASYGSRRKSLLTFFMSIVLRRFLRYLSTTMTRTSVGRVNSRRSRSKVVISGSWGGRVYRSRGASRYALFGNFLRFRRRSSSRGSTRTFVGGYSRRLSGGRRRYRVSMRLYLM